MGTLTNHYHKGDLPSGMTFSGSIAVDCETMGLNFHRDRLCVVQLSAGDGECHVVHLNRDYDAPNLKAILADPDLLKIFHYARFDVASIAQWLNVECTPVYCTKIASKLTRTNTDRHSLKALALELLGVDLNKQQQSSDWGADSLTDEQIEYAASDVRYLHRLKDILDGLLEREGRRDLAQACFNFLPARAQLDLVGWNDFDIFAH